jgi:hypothetical protein
MVAVYAEQVAKGMDRDLGTCCITRTLATVVLRRACDAHLGPTDRLPGVSRTGHSPGNLS